jgi:hypothetical protein
MPEKIPILAGDANAPFPARACPSVLAGARAGTIVVTVRVRCCRGNFGDFGDACGFAAGCFLTGRRDLLTLTCGFPIRTEGFATGALTRAGGATGVTTLGAGLGTMTGAGAGRAGAGRTRADGAASGCGVEMPPGLLTVIVGFGGLSASAESGIAAARASTVKACTNSTGTFGVPVTRR